LSFEVIELISSTAYKDVKAVSAKEIELTSWASVLYCFSRFDAFYLKVSDEAPSARGTDILSFFEL